MSFTHNPLRRALIAAGATGIDDVFTYQDYLYELLGDGSSEKPVTEQQWEMICDLQGSRRLYYASNSKMALENIEGKQK